MEFLYIFYFIFYFEGLVFIYVQEEASDVTKSQLCCTNLQTRRN